MDDSPTVDEMVAYLDWRDRVFHHEAGHMAASLAYGCRPIQLDLTSDPDRNFVAAVYHESFDLERFYSKFCAEPHPEAQSFYEAVAMKQAFVLLSGMAAEMAASGGDEQIARRGAADDRKRAFVILDHHIKGDVPAAFARAEAAAHAFVARPDVLAFVQTLAYQLGDWMADVGCWIPKGEPVVVEERDIEELVADAGGEALLDIWFAEGN